KTWRPTARRRKRLPLFAGAGACATKRLSAPTPTSAGSSRWLPPWTGPTMLLSSCRPAASSARTSLSDDAQENFHESQEDELHGKRDAPVPGAHRRRNRGYLLLGAARPLGDRRARLRAGRHRPRPLRRRDG